MTGRNSQCTCTHQRNNADCNKSSYEALHRFIIQIRCVMNRETAYRIMRIDTVPRFSWRLMLLWNCLCRICLNIFGRICSDLQRMKCCHWGECIVLYYKLYTEVVWLDSGCLNWKYWQLLCDFCHLADLPEGMTNSLSFFLLINNLTHFSNVFISFTSLHVSSNPVLIIRRINCINTSSGIYHFLVFVYLFCLFNIAKFYIPLTVHLGIILVNNQLDALFQCIYLFHFSNITVIPVVVLIQLILLMMSTGLLETCR
jgi:hypothetical protein